MSDDINDYISRRILADEYGSPYTTQTASGGGARNLTNVEKQHNKKVDVENEGRRALIDYARQKGKEAIWARRAAATSRIAQSLINDAEWEQRRNHKKIKSYSHKKMPRTYRKRSGARKPKIFIAADGTVTGARGNYRHKATGVVYVRPNVKRARLRAANPQDPFGVEPTSTEQWDATDFGQSKALATRKQLLNRAAAGYTGRGMYGGQGKYGLGKAMNRARGYIAGATKLAGAGMAAYNTVKGFSGGGMYGGQGAYGNALMEGGEMSMKVYHQDDETDSITLTNREFVKEIYAPTNTVVGSSSSFASEIIQVNAGLPSFAPKLSAIAANYQQYEIKQLVYELVPLISESNVNNGLTGTIMMVFNYDPTSDPFDNKEDVMQSSGAVSGRIVDHLTCGVECDTNKTKDTEYFIRTCPVPYGRDADEFDHGRLIVATNNLPQVFSNLTIAELYVYYTVELRHFKPGTIRLNGQQRDLWVTSSTALNNRTQLQTPVDNFANNEVLYAQQSNLGCELKSGGPQAWSLTFPPDFSGYVEVRINLEGTTLVGPSWTITKAAGVNVEEVADMYAVGGAGDAPASSHGVLALGQLNASFTAHLKVRAATSNTPNLVTFTNSGAGGGQVSQWSFEVIEISQNYFQSRKNPIPVFQNVANGLIQTA